MGKKNLSVHKWSRVIYFPFLFVGVAMHVGVSMFIILISGHPGI
jgi:hypothetical protein